MFSSYGSESKVIDYCKPSYKIGQQFVGTKYSQKLQYKLTGIYCNIPDPNNLTGQVSKYKRIDSATTVRDLLNFMTSYRYSDAYAMGSRLNCKSIIWKYILTTGIDDNDTIETDGEGLKSMITNGSIKLQGGGSNTFRKRKTRRKVRSLKSK